jgi:predicted RNA-binding Zn-ribbon protein involved in translation (DUF1610 family)
MANKCTRCQADTRFRAEVAGWSAGERHMVFECPACGRIDWKPVESTAKGSNEVFDRPLDV